MTTTSEDFEVSFLRGGNYRDIILSGWDDKEVSHVWAVGASSEIDLTDLRLSFPLYMKITATPFVVPDRLPMQRLIVRMDGQTLAEFSMSKRETVTCIIPATAGSASRCRILLQHPDASRPMDLYNSPDTRYLAFAYHSLLLTSSPPIAGPGVELTPSVKRDVVDLAAGSRVDHSARDVVAADPNQSIGAETPSSDDQPGQAGPTSLPSKSSGRSPRAKGLGRIFRRVT